MIDSDNLKLGGLLCSMGVGFLYMAWHDPDIAFMVFWAGLSFITWGILVIIE